MTESWFRETLTYPQPAEAGLRRCVVQVLAFPLLLTQTTRVPQNALLCIVLSK